MKSYKPCDLFQMSGRTAAVHQAVEVLTKILKRTLAESLIGLVGEGVGLEVATEYPARVSQIKTAVNTLFAWECGVEDNCIGMVSLDNILCSALLEKVCGATGDIAQDIEKVDILTPTEHRFAKRIVIVVLEQFARLLKVNEPFQLLENRDNERQLPHNMRICLFNIHVYVPSFSGSIQVWLPEVLISSPSYEKVGRNNLMRAVGKAPLDVNAVLSYQTITLGKVLSLKVGDDLPLFIPDTAEIYCDSVFLGCARIVGKNHFLALALE